MQLGGYSLKSPAFRPPGPPDKLNQAWKSGLNGVCRRTWRDSWAAGQHYQMV